jgi:hypothetical protein
MANEYLKRTPTSTGNRKVFTISFWKKHAGPGGLSTLDFSAVGNAVNDNNNRSILYWSDSNSFDYYHNLAGVEKLRRGENQGAHRDPSSWCHTLVSTDTTKNETKIYINGTEIQYSLITNTQNFETWINSTYKHSIGSQFGGSFFNKTNYFDFFLVDGQALTPEVFGFYKDGNGYISAGSTQATDFRNGQWVPRTPREIKNLINENGGFGVNGFYLPMNDSSNFGADFHCEPNSIITLKGENLPQPRNGAPETTDAYVSQLREDPYAANLVLAVPGISTSTSANLVSNGTFENGTSGWTADTGATLSILEGALRITVSQTAGARQSFPVTSGQRYTLSFRVRTDGTNFSNFAVDAGGTTQYIGNYSGTGWTYFTKSFTPTSSTVELRPYKATGGWAEFDDIVFKQEDVPRDYSADIKGSGTNKTLTAVGDAGVGYEIPSYYGSALSFDGSGDGFKTQDVSSDFSFGTGDFTFEAWVYSTNVGSAGNIFGDYYENTTNTVTNWQLLKTSIERLTFYLLDSSGSKTLSTTSSSYINNQWNHIVAERYDGILTIYVNGVAGATDTTFNYNLGMGRRLFIGIDANESAEPFSGYIQDVRIYKGVAKYKGGFDVPKPYTPVGISTWRAVPDTCQNNFATLNPLKSGMTLSDGNLKATSTGYSATLATIGAKTGKYYYEGFVQDVGGTSFAIGVGFVNTNTGTYGGAGTYDIVYTGPLIYGNSTNLQTGLSSPATGDTIGVALNFDSSVITFYKNGVLVTSQNLTSGIEYFPCVADNSSSGTVISVLNFGQNPTFSGNTTAGTFTDSNGKGLFKYQPPSGFLALCEDNLPTPTIKDPGEHFKTVLYRGDSNSGRSITGVGFQPDLVWVKPRNTTAFHHLFDSVRGPKNVLFSNATNAESSSESIISFDSDGFSLGTAGINDSSQDVVAWCWKAGGPAVTNPDGTITAQVSANPTAGFSIATYTGASGGTVGHGLGKKPSFIIEKKRNTTSDWIVTTDVIDGSLDYLRLNLNSVKADAVISAPTSTVFTPNIGSGTVVAYIWTEIEGFSKFGSYVGNGSADGPFVYCGFKPAFLLLKIASPSGQERDWHIYDSARNSTNIVGLNLRPSSNDLEINEPGIDFLSNGFKIRSNYIFSNYSGGTIIFAAFAESPFKYANSK